MKKQLIFFMNFILLGFLYTSLVFAQAPEKFTFQGEARDNYGTVIRNQDIEVKITILAGFLDETQTIAWEDIYDIRTDKYGLFTLTIGEGTDLSSIDWANDSYFLNVQVTDWKGDWVDMGTTQLLSVPYALHAKTAANMDVIPGDKVGIGVQDPQEALDVLGNVHASEGFIAGSTTYYNDGAITFEAPHEDLDIDNGTLFIDGVNNLVGIGTTEPSEKLEVNGIVKAKSFVFSPNGNSVFIGVGAGTHDNLVNNRNVFIGVFAGHFNTSGSRNTANGSYALHINNTGSLNTATGSNALRHNTAGHHNTANGSNALYWNTTGGSNTATGFDALYWNTTGIVNTATGSNALYSNTTGSQNTANGFHTLYSNETGYNNTANGYFALNKNTSGYNNTANGSQALINNLEGENNTANGFNALQENTSGSGNTAIGGGALYSNTTGSYNTAVGTGSGPWDALDDLTNTGAFGYQAKVSASNTIRIGNEDITQIGGAVGWSNLSDGRFKINVTSEIPGLDFVMKLRPITFNWDLEALNQFQGIDNEDIKNNPEMVKAKMEKKTKVYTGLIAQEVEEAAEEIGYDFSGIIKPANEKSIYNLAYAEFVVPLIKAIQEQQQMIEELQQEIENLKSQ